MSEVSELSVNNSEISSPSEFQFLGESKIGENIWKMYGLDFLENTVILDPETFVPYQPLEPVRCQMRIGVLGEKVRKFPSLLKGGQVVDCVNVENPSDRRTIKTSWNR
jgi:hypothetical protein